MPRDLLAEEKQPRDLLAEQEATQPTSAQPVRVPTQSELVLEKYRTGGLTPEQETAAEVFLSRSGVDVGKEIRGKAMREMAEEINPFRSFLVGMGKGFVDVGRGIGLVDEADATEKEAMAALAEERPYTSGAGEIVGQAAPFAIPGTAAGRIPSLAGRIAGGMATGALEGGVIAEGTGGDAIESAGVGAAIGGLSEAIIPVVGRLGGKIVRKVTGRSPKGELIDSAGRPSPELSDALQKQGITFEQLTDDALEFIGVQKPGASAEQVARGARFAEAGVPITKGELTKEFAQQKSEQQLFESATAKEADRFRDFKLKQSQAIDKSLRGAFGDEFAQEETGELIKQALYGRKKLLRSQKNELYAQSAESAKEAGVVPIIDDAISDAIPDADTLEDLAITAPQAMKSLDQLLTKYGLKEPSESMLDAGFEPKQLTVQNVERFRKSLNAIERGDNTGASSVAIGRIKSALDDEMDAVGNALKEKGFPKDVFEPLIQARSIVRELKTEFEPRTLIGRIVDPKKDGITQQIEASKVYSKLSSKATPVEDVRRVVRSLSKAEGGDQALAAMRSSVVLDLIDAGFGTNSRQVQGVKVFNPTAFKKRLSNIGEDKVMAIFGGDREAMKKLMDIDNIASDLIPPAGAVPKGSASAILDLVNRLGLGAVSAKFPGASIVHGAIKQLAEPVKVGREVTKAIEATPDVAKARNMIEMTFPGIASALGISAITAEEGE